MQQAVLSASPRASLATAHLVGANSGDPIDNADGVVTPDGCADGRVRLPAEKMRTAAEFAGLNIGSVVDLRREFENPCPALKTLSLRRSRGFYKQDRRSSGPTVADSRGRMVRSVEMAQTLLRPEQVDDLVSEYRSGATLVELAAQFRVNRRTVAAHLVRREVPIRRGSFDPSRIHEAADLYLSGLTLAEVGVKGLFGHSVGITG